MNATVKTALASALISLTLFSCNKTATMKGAGPEAEATDYAVTVSDSISPVATQVIEGKQFIKTASVEMEVDDVYKATLEIENSVKELGGFLTGSHLETTTVSEETHNTGAEQAVLLRKYQSENRMQAKIPTEKLGEFLQNLNDKSRFLLSRSIDAEDITANMKYAEMEAQRAAETKKNISGLTDDKDKIKLADSNRSDQNSQKLYSLQVSDQLKYSAVDIYLKEPKVRVAEIPVLNTKTLDNKYRISFWYELKMSLKEGFYFILSIVLGLLKIWPLVIVGVTLYLLYQKRKIKKKRS